VRQYTSGEDDSSVDFHALPLKHDIISCLAVGARWITSVPLLQVLHVEMSRMSSLGAVEYRGLSAPGNFAFPPIALSRVGELPLSGAREPFYNRGSRSKSKFYHVT